MTITLTDARGKKYELPIDSTSKVGDLAVVDDDSVTVMCGYTIKLTNKKRLVMN